MTPNLLIKYTLGDVQYGQLAPSKVSRTNFTPGKATARPLDMNWPTDFRIPTGTPAFNREAAGPVNMGRDVSVKTGRGIICDQELKAPITGAPITTTIVNPSVYGAATPSHVLTPTNTQDVGKVIEKTIGNDNIEGI